MELLQPNPHARTKVAWMTSYSRAAGNTENTPKYPHGELSLAKRFSKFAERMNDATAYTAALRLVRGIPWGPVVGSSVQTSDA